MPSGCVFGHKGPAVFPKKEADTFYLLGVANSTPAEYLLRGLMSFGSWEVGVIKRLPVPVPSLDQRAQIANIARNIHQAKTNWDRGNELSAAFVAPWLLSREIHESLSITDALNRLAEFEQTEDNRIQDPVRGSQQSRLCRLWHSSRYSQGDRRGYGAASARSHLATDGREGA